MGILNKKQKEHRLIPEHQKKKIQEEKTTKSKDKDIVQPAIKKPTQAEVDEVLNTLDELEKVWCEQAKSNIEVVEPKEKKANEIVKKFVYKPTRNKKLNIILVENTNAVANERETIAKIVKSLDKASLTVIINYGQLVKQSPIMETINVDSNALLNGSDLGEKACLYDAIYTMYNLVTEVFLSVQEKEFEKIFINNIEIIGIGKCLDNCSYVYEDEALRYFYEVATKRHITTKYFCLTEETFVDAAAIGFHSIGAIIRNY